MSCPECGVELIPGANYCHNCGTCVSEAGDDESLQPVAGTRVESIGALPRQTKTAVNLGSAPFPLEGPGAAEDSESEVWSGGFSPKAMALSFVVILSLTLAGLTIALFAAFQHVAWLWVGMLIAIPPLWVVQFGRLAKRCLGAHYRLTSRRLLRQLGMFSRHKDQLELTRVESVRTLQNVLQRFLDTGSIEILSSDRQLRRLVMEGIANADEVAETIRGLAQARRGKPGVAERSSATR